MKVALLVEDRDDGYLFLNADKAPVGARAYELVSVHGVPLAEIGNDDIALWLMNDQDELRVVARESYDFENEPMDTEYPVPAPIICLDSDDPTWIAAL